MPKLSGTLFADQLIGNAAAPNAVAAAAAPPAGIGKVGGAPGVPAPAANPAMPTPGAPGVPAPGAPGVPTPGIPGAPVPPSNPIPPGMVDKLVEGATPEANADVATGDAPHASYDKEMRELYCSKSKTTGKVECFKSQHPDHGEKPLSFKDVFQENIPPQIEKFSDLIINQQMRPMIIKRVQAPYVPNQDPKDDSLMGMTDSDTKKASKTMEGQPVLTPAQKEVLNIEDAPKPKNQPLAPKIPRHINEEEPVKKKESGNEDFSHEDIRCFNGPVEVPCNPASIRPPETNEGSVQESTIGECAVQALPAEAFEKDDDKESKQSGPSTREGSKTVDSSTDKSSEMDQLILQEHIITLAKEYYDVEGNPIMKEYVDSEIERMNSKELHDNGSDDGYNSLGEEWNSICAPESIGDVPYDEFKSIGDMSDCDPCLDELPPLEPMENDIYYDIEKIDEDVNENYGKGDNSRPTLRACVENDKKKEAVKAKSRMGVRVRPRSPLPERPVAPPPPPKPTCGDAECTECQFDPKIQKKPNGGGLKTTISHPSSLERERRDVPPCDPAYAEQYMMYAQQYAAYAQHFAMYAQYCAQLGQLTEEQQKLAAPMLSIAEEPSAPSTVAPAGCASSSCADSSCGVPCPPTAQAPASGTPAQPQPQTQGQIQSQPNAVTKAKAKAQPKNAPKPIMITPYRHNWLISGDHVEENKVDGDSKNDGDDEDKNKGEEDEKSWNDAIRRYTGFDLEKIQEQCRRCTTPFATAS